MKYENNTMLQMLDKHLTNGGIVTLDDVLQRVEAEGLVIKLTKHNKKRLRKVVERLNSLGDKGKIGKAVELLVRCLIIPNSEKLEVGKHNETDVRFKLAERFLSVEVKTESGDITLSPIFHKKDWTMENLIAGQKSPYVLYSINGTLEELRLIETERFFQILNEYQTKRAPMWGMLNPIEKVGNPNEDGNYRLGLQVKPGNCKARRRWLWEALQGEGITLKEILEMRG